MALTAEVAYSGRIGSRLESAMNGLVLVVGRGCGLILPVRIFLPRHTVKQAIAFSQSCAVSLRIIPMVATLHSNIQVLSIGCAMAPVLACAGDSLAAGP